MRLAGDEVHDERRAEAVGIIGAPPDTRDRDPCDGRRLEQRELAGATRLDDVTGRVASQHERLLASVRMPGGEEPDLPRRAAREPLRGVDRDVRAEPGANVRCQTLGEISRRDRGTPTSRSRLARATATR